MHEIRLGRSIATIVPFVRIQQPKQQEDKPLIGTKLIILFAVIAIAKIAVLLML